MKLLWRTPIKIHRRADRRRQPRSREHRFSTAKATSSTQRPQTCTEAATKYYNYTVNETDEEREHRLPTRLDQATLLKVYSQNYLDCQSGNVKNYASGNHVSTSSCILRTGILIAFNITCMWTFHRNTLLHEYLFLMHVHK